MATINTANIEDYTGWDGLGESHSDADRRYFFDDISAQRLSTTVSTAVTNSTTADLASVSGVQTGDWFYTGSGAGVLQHTISGISGNTITFSPAATLNAAAISIRRALGTGSGTSGGTSINNPDGDDFLAENFHFVTPRIVQTDGGQYTDGDGNTQQHRYTFRNGNIVFTSGTVGFSGSSSTLAQGLGANTGGIWDFENVNFLATGSGTTGAPGVNGFGVTGSSRPTVLMDNVTFRGIDDSSWFVNFQSADFNDSLISNVSFVQSVLNGFEHTPLQRLSFDGTIRATGGGNHYTYRNTWLGSSTDDWTFLEGFTFNGTGQLASGTAAAYRTGSDTPCHIQHGNPPVSGSERWYFIVNANVETDNIFIGSLNDGYSSSRRLINYSLYSWNPVFIDDRDGSEITDVRITGLPDYWTSPSGAVNLAHTPTSSGGSTVTAPRPRDGELEAADPIWIQVGNSNIIANNTTIALAKAFNEDGSFAVSDADRTVVPKSYTHATTASIMTDVNPFTYSGGRSGTITYDSESTYRYVPDLYVSQGGVSVSPPTSVSDLDGLYRQLKNAWRNDNNDLVYPFSFSSGNLDCGSVDIIFDQTSSGSGEVAYTVSGGAYTVATITQNNSTAVQIAQGPEHFTGILTTGDVRMPASQTIAINIDCDTLTFDSSVPSTLIEAGTINATLNNLVRGNTYEITGGDVTDLDIGSITGSSGTVTINVDSGVAGATAFRNNNNDPTNDVVVNVVTAAVFYSVTPDIPAGTTGRFTLRNLDATSNQNEVVGTWASDGTITYTTGSATGLSFNSTNTTNYRLYVKANSTIGGQVYRINTFSFTTLTRDIFVAPLEVNTFFTQNASGITNVGIAFEANTGTTLEGRWSDETATATVTAVGTQAAVMIGCNDANYFNWHVAQEHTVDHIDYNPSAVVVNSSVDGLTTASGEGVIFSSDTNTTQTIIRNTAGFLTQSTGGRTLFSTGVRQVISQPELAADLDTVNNAIASMFDEVVPELKQNQVDIAAKVDGVSLGIPQQGAISNP